MPACIGSRQQQQTLNQAGRALRFEQNLRHIVVQIGRRTLTASGEFGGRPNDRHRRPQLMRGVGRELRHALNGGLKPLEHTIHGFRQALQFVAGRRHVEAVGQIRDADRLGRIGDGVHRSEGAAADPKSAQACPGEQQRHQQPQSLAEAAERLKQRAHRRSDLYQVGTACNINARGSAPHGLRLDIEIGEDCLAARDEVLRFQDRDIALLEHRRTVDPRATLGGDLNQVAARAQDGMLVEFVRQIHVGLGRQLCANELFESAQAIAQFGVDRGLRAEPHSEPASRGEEREAERQNRQVPNREPDAD